MIKKILGGIICAAVICSGAYADHMHNTYVINAIDSNAIYVNDIYTSIVPVRIPLDRILFTPQNIEPGIMIHVHCEANNKVNMRLVGDGEIEKFNTMYEDFLSRFVAYDPDFVEVLIQKYEQSPIENYILKALLSSTLTNGDFMDLQYNKGNTYALNTIDALCDQSIDNLHMRGDDRFFLQTMAKDVVSGTKIVSRKERGADENISKPKPASTGAVETGTTSNWAGETTSNTQTIRKNYLTYFNETDKVKAISYASNPDRRPLEYFPANRIIIHHTAGEYEPTKADGTAYMKSVHKYHGSTLGWGDVGYHFLIDGVGTIYEGRRGGMQTVGAHVLGHNRGSVGISLMSDSKYSVPMLVSLVQLTLYLGEEYGIDVTSTDMFKNPDVTALEQGPTVVAHKELTPTKPHDPDINMSLFRKILEKVKEQNPGLVDALKK